MRYYSLLRLGLRGALPCGRVLRRTALRCMISLSLYRCCTPFYLQLFLLDTRFVSRHQTLRYVTGLMCCAARTHNVGDLGPHGWGCFTKGHDKTGKGRGKETSRHTKLRPTKGCNATTLPPSSDYRRDTKSESLAQTLHTHITHTFRGRCSLPHRLIIERGERKRFKHP